MIILYKQIIFFLRVNKYKGHSLKCKILKIDFELDIELPITLHYTTYIITNFQSMNVIDLAADC